MDIKKKSIQISRNNVIKFRPKSNSEQPSLQLTRDEIFDLIKISVGEDVISLIEYELLSDINEDNSGKSISEVIHDYIDDENFKRYVIYTNDPTEELS